MVLPIVRLDVPWLKELELAQRAARLAGEAALAHQSRGLTPISKPDLTPVTVADQEGERLICNTLLGACPDDGVLGEEGASGEGRSGRRWIIDPIDGTRDFIRGLPQWAILIGLEDQGEIVAGVMYNPSTLDMFWAAAGEGAWCNQTRLTASNIEGKANALVCVNGFNAARQFEWGKHLTDRLAGYWAVRSLGGCTDAAMLAAGKAEIWLEPVAKAWDLAPLKILIEEAGAYLTSFTGEPTIYGGNALAFTSPMRREAFQLVAP